MILGFGLTDAIVDILEDIKTDKQLRNMQVAFISNSVGLFWAKTWKILIVLCFFSKI
jgi:hypothetical protein